jgi:hypothetical protein
VRTGALHLAAPAQRISLASPFDYPAATRLFVVKDVRRGDMNQVAAAYRELFRASGLTDPADTSPNLSALLKTAIEGDAKDRLIGPDPDPLGEAMLEGIRERKADSLFIAFLRDMAEEVGGCVTADAVLAAICCHLAWRPLLHKRLSVITLANMPWHFRLFGAVVGGSVRPERQTETTFGGVPMTELISGWSFTETTFLALLTRRPDPEERFAFTILLGLTSSNGPGTITAQGCKGAVSADGPEVPERVQINKAYVGFLSHAGYAHGGNGFEAMQFLIERFGGRDLPDPGDPEHGLDLPGLAAAYAQEYKAYKIRAKAAGNLSYAKIPCINHPIFKGKDVNFDPREVYVHDLLNERGSYNVFHAFYHELVKALASYGVSRNVYCVNIDAVIAVILLKMMWQPA